MRRKILQFVWIPLFLLTVSQATEANNQGQIDREYWADLLYRMAEPVLKNMSTGELVKNMEVEYSPAWQHHSKKVIYMETFGRLMSGLAPWLSLPDDNTREGKQRRQLREWALKSYAHAVDPNSPDFFEWDKEPQALVDASYIANSFLRAPGQLWEPLDTLTKARYIEQFQCLRWVKPPYSNWLLFGAMIETFLLSVDAGYDAFRIDIGVRKTEEWYVGDGWYSDGPHFAFDYYNSYVIQPMYVEILEVLRNKKTINTSGFEPALERMQRFGEILERLISPEGTYPAVGRSVTYRMGAFQPLALLVWRYELPSTLGYGQIRSALTAVMKQMFSNKANFNEAGFLQLGFVGHQPEVSDYYTNNGSLYLTSLAFLPLGLPADHPFWTDQSEDWTARKAWSGDSFLKDKAIK